MWKKFKEFLFGKYIKEELVVKDAIVTVTEVNDNVHTFEVLGYNDYHFEKYYSRTGKDIVKDWLNSKPTFLVISNLILPVYRIKNISIAENIRKEEINKKVGGLF